MTGHYQGGIGFHPLTAWCSNTGDHLAVMQRPGNASSFTSARILSMGWCDGQDRSGNAGVQASTAAMTRSRRRPRRNP